MLLTPTRSVPGQFMTYATMKMGGESFVLVPAAEFKVMRRPRKLPSLPSACA